MYVSRSTLILSITSVLFLTSSVSAGHKLVHPPDPADPMAVHIYELDNGLTVYLTENHETPRFYAEIAVRAGSKHDPAESTGLAHYLEHMLFKGSQKIGTLSYEKEKPHLHRILELYEEHFNEEDPEKRRAIYEQINRESQLTAPYVIPNEFHALYKSMGASGLNAHTWHEETVYRVNLPSNRMRQWAVIESERFSNPVFRLFQLELEIVYEEKNRTLDNKDRVIRYAVNKQLYKKHPYGQQTTIGNVDHLKNPSLKNVYQYYNTYYVPNNLAIFISGDIDVQETIQLIDEHFSIWKAKPLPKLKRWREKPLEKPERVTVNYQGEEFVLLAFRTAPTGHRNADALELLDMILDNRTAGLINLNLNQRQRVRNAGSYPHLLNDHGAQYLYAVPKRDQTLEEVESLLLEQLDNIKQGTFEDWILPAIVTDFKKTRKSRLESNSGRVRLMRTAFIEFEDWSHAVNTIPRMEALTKKNIIRVAKAYFHKGYVAGRRIDEAPEIPKIEKPKIDKIEIDGTRQSAFAKSVQALPYEEIEPVFVDPEKDFTIFDYHEGVKLYHSKNPINDLFSLDISIDFGTHQDNKIGMATQLMDKAGSRTFGAEALKKEWYKIGTDFSISAGDNDTHISISGIDENFESSVAMLMDFVKTPKADRKTLEELIKITLAKREDAKKDHRSIRSALEQFNRYGKDSYYLRQLSNEALQALTVDELLRIVKNLLSYKHTITYTGSASLDEVVSVLKKHHVIPEPLQDPPPYRFLKTRTVEGDEILFVHKDMAQAHLRIEVGDEEYNETNRPAVELYNVYFGRRGIAFEQLREARALAYSAGALYLTGERKGDQNIMVGAIGCQPDKVVEALEAFKDLMDNLPVEPERFEQARQSVINRYRTSKLGFREVLGAVRSWEKLGVPVDPRKNRFERVQVAEIDLMLAFHKVHLKSQPKLISVVGDRERINTGALQKLGKWVEVDLEDIFAY